MTRDLWNIEKEFEKMRRQMDSLLNNFFNDSFDKNISLLEGPTKNGRNELSLKTPATDLYETDREVVAKIEVPGVDKKDIKLEVKNGILSLRAEQNFEKEDKDEKKGYHRIERSYSGFVRSFSLPNNIDEEKVKASYKNGILEVHISKKNEIKNNDVKYIDIE